MDRFVIVVLMLCVDVGAEMTEPFGNSTWIGLLVGQCRAICYEELGERRNDTVLSGRVLSTLKCPSRSNCSHCGDGCEDKCVEAHNQYCARGGHIGVTVKNRFAQAGIASHDIQQLQADSSIVLQTVRLHCFAPDRKGYIEDNSRPLKANAIFVVWLNFEIVGLPIVYLFESKFRLPKYIPKDQKHVYEETLWLGAGKPNAYEYIPMFRLNGMMLDVEHRVRVAGLLPNGTIGGFAYTDWFKTPTHELMTSVLRKPPSLESVSWVRYTNVRLDRLDAVFYLKPNSTYPSCYYEIVVFSPHSAQVASKTFLLDRYQEGTAMNLTFDTQYQVQFAAISNPNSPYERSDVYVVEISTPTCLEAHNYSYAMCAPERVETLIYTVNTTALTVSLMWQPPSHWHEVLNPIDHYIVHYTVVDMPFDDYAKNVAQKSECNHNLNETSIQLLSNITEFVLSGIQLHCRYGVYVTPVSVAGRGQVAYRDLDVPSFASVEGSHVDEEGHLADRELFAVVGVPLCIVFVCVVIMTMISRKYQWCPWDKGKESPQGMRVNVQHGNSNSFFNYLLMRNLQRNSTYNATATALSPIASTELSAMHASNFITSTSVSIADSVNLNSRFSNTMGDNYRHLPVDAEFSKAVNLIKQLGEGAFGRVFKAYCRLSRFPSTVAIKMLKEYCPEEAKRNLQREITLMIALKPHPGVVQVFGYWQSPLALVMEYCPLGSLKSYLESLRPQVSPLLRSNSVSNSQQNSPVDSGISPSMMSRSSRGSLASHMSHMSHTFSDPCESGMTALSEVLEDCSDFPKLLLSYCVQVATAMIHISAAGLVHRDLAARNVLVTDGGRVVKVSDFGLTRYQTDGIYAQVTNIGGEIGIPYLVFLQTSSSTNPKRTSYCGFTGQLPIKWMAPEAIEQKVFTEASDVWSFGILMYEIVTVGGNPYPGVLPHDVVGLVKRLYRLSKPENCGDRMYEVMMECWAQQPCLRPSFAQLRVVLEGMLINQCGYISLDLPAHADYYAVP